MKKIPNESIKKWAYSNSNKLSHPVSVAAICPGCTLNVVFNTKRRLYDPNRDTSSCSSDCSACGTTVHFWVVDMVGHARKDGDGDPGVYMLPAPHEHMNMDQHQETIPDSVLQYCKTAQEIYFSGNLMATNVLIKTAMETIFDDFLPIGNSRTGLSAMIRDSISTINHNEPLAKLSSSTKKQGDLHELFKNHHGTNQDTADAMMEMLETLIMYLYILPSRFEDLEQRLADLKKASENSETLADKGTRHDSMQPGDGYDDDDLDKAA
ncbi:MAG: hypothetical protein AB8B97_11230 [Granulosicoccus sp.]